MFIFPLIIDSKKWFYVSHNEVVCYLIYLGSKINIFLSQCVDYLLLPNKLPQSLIAWNNRFYGAGMQVQFTAVFYSKATKCFWAIVILSFDWGKIIFQVHVAVGRTRFLIDYWTQGLSSLPHEVLQNAAFESRRQQRNSTSKTKITIFCCLVMDMTYFQCCCMYWLEAAPQREKTNQGHEHQKVEIRGDILEADSYMNQNQYNKIKSIILK